jgi:hypothetical protein
MRELQPIASENGENRPNCGGSRSVNPSSDRTSKHEVQPGMKSLRCEVSARAKRELKVRAAEDEVTIGEAADKALLNGLTPPSSIEEQLAALLPRIDRQSFANLDRRRRQENKTLQQYMYQALILLERQLSGQPLSLEPPFVSNVRAPIQPPRPSSNSGDNSRRTLPSNFTPDLGVVDVRDDEDDASGTRPVVPKR